MENKTGKYFKYAIGEIVLVVIGILIALWLNNLNSEKKRTIQEISILKGLKKDFQADIGDFKLNISGYNYISYSIDRVLERLESSAGYNDSLDYVFAGTINWPLSIIHNNSFEVLQSNGLDLISNDSLRNDILRFHGQVYVSLKMWEDEYNRAIYFDEMIKRFDKVEPWRFTSDGKFHMGKMKPNNYNTLKKDTLYKSLLRSMKRDAEQLNYMKYRTLIDDIENVISHIDNELVKLE
jgi:hypothetical protein